MERESSRVLEWLLIGIVLAVGIAALLFAFFVPTGTGYGFMDGMMGVGSGWMAVGVVFMLVPVVFLVLILLVVVNALKPTPPPLAYSVPSVPSAMEILNARYARGEITPEDYARMRADLEGSGR